jgi:lipopolysaccharide transport system ATP-binding protein
VQPDILIIDEALSVGDMQFQVKCMSAMRRFQENGVSILLVSHDPTTIRSFCSRGILLRQGQIEALGKASEISDLYHRIMREEMLEKGLKKEEVSSAFAAQKETNALDEQTVCPVVEKGAGFKVDEEFTNRVASSRYGSGEALVTAVELLDENNETIIEAAFDQQVKIRIHVLLKAEVEFSIGYHIRDKYNISLLSSGSFLETETMLKGEPDDKFVLEFNTHLPLNQGIYSIMVLVSKNYIPNKVAQMVDVIENALVLKIQPRHPFNIWSKLYVKNSLQISKC